MVLTNGLLSNQRTTAANLLQRAWQFNKWLTLLLVVNLGLLAIGIVGLIADPRLVLNAPDWAKTVKFAISIEVYGITLLWMLTFVKQRSRAAQFVASAVGILLLGEMVMIVLQAVRGVPMHFNQSTPFDTAVWRVMTISIFVFFAIDIVGAVLLLRERMTNPVLATSIRLGLIMSLIGMSLAFAMTGPTAPQMAVLQSGGALTMMGAHNVGALVDGGTRMIPLLGWNMDGGDLRIAHFIGMHGAQVIPLVGALLLARGSRGLTERRTVALVWTAAAAWLGLTLVVFWQALRNQSIIAPDGLTLGALAAVVGATALATAVIARRPAAVVKA